MCRRQWPVLCAAVIACLLAQPARAQQDNSWLSPRSYGTAPSYPDPGRYTESPQFTPLVRDGHRSQYEQAPSYPPQVYESTPLNQDYPGDIPGAELGIDYAAPDSIESVFASGEPWEWHLRPRGFLYRTYWASAAEPRLSTQVVSEKSDGTLQDSHIGGRVGIVRYGPRNSEAGFQLDVLGGAKLRQETQRLDVVATDFRYDIVGSYGNGPHRYKFGFYHVSSHLGDEFLIANPTFNRLNFVRDTLVFGYSFYPDPNWRLYAETGYAFNTDVSEPWEFQFGVDYGPYCPTGFRGAPFFAFNGHLREELNFGGNLALQAGWAWKGYENDGTIRTGLYYYNGGSPQFSFFAIHEEQVGWGLWYDF